MCYLKVVPILLMLIYLLHFGMMMMHDDDDDDVFMCFLLGGLHVPVPCDNLLEHHVWRDVMLTVGNTVRKWNVLLEK